MATTTGPVQRLSILSQTTACVWIGPTPDNSEVLAVSNDGSAADTAYAANLVQSLAAAATNYRVVAAGHGDGDAKITSVEIDPV
ncbi:hypothetical protein LRS74_30605 [Streptomyces sp. LX-29]|uniref:hypothetical protein n=1 Tax=Streptomyces sp. LX-29 TaxID=2900152 RepID=UPI0005D81A01|nr:hypothetical protein [Streptomyces sp. LX-29]AJT69918.1 hypothetical protein T261_8325 [Streptomyces lydicus]WFB10912.1 hypothetical protein LRS74_30605 [Streptomyces sp. LX-29]